MRTIRRTLGGASWWAAHAIAFGAALAAAQSAKTLQPPFIPELTWLYWIFVAAVMLGLAGLIQAPGVPRSARPPTSRRTAGQAASGTSGQGLGRRVWRLACGMVICGAAGAWIGVEVNIEGKVEAEVVTRAWAALLLLAGVSFLVVRAGRETASRTTTPMAVLTALLAGLWLGLASSPSPAVRTWWQALTAGGSERARRRRASAAATSSLLLRIDIEDRAPTDPTGLFATSSPDRSFGWHWVRSGQSWHEALLVQPPTRVQAHTPMPADGRVRVYAALPEQHVTRGRQSVVVRCAVTDPHGREVAADRRVLQIGGEIPPRPWEVFEFDISGAAGSAFEVTLSAESEDRDVPPGNVALLAVGTPRPDAAANPGPAGPNCVIILVDALRPDRLHCYGCPQATSPRIDRLAAEGVLFERVQSACSWTAPSVASLFTGTYVATHKMLEFTLPGRLSLPTLATRFREAGARTAAVSANRLVCPPGGFGPGFDEFTGSVKFEGKQSPRADWVTDHAIARLRQLNGQRFFLYLHYMDPHQDYDPPAGWARFGWTDEERYLGEIRYCDGEIARLLAELDALGRADETFVVFIADHGEAFMEHGCRGHGWTVHREEVEVPLILRWPGRVPAGRRVTTRVRSIDVTATILDLMGLSMPRHVEGESLRPLLGDGSPARDRLTFSETATRGLVRDQARFVALADGRHKLVLDRRRKQSLLYDVETDPDERTDLSVQMPDRAAAMKRVIEQFLKQRRAATTQPARPPTTTEREIMKNLGYLNPGEKTPPSERPEP